MVCHRSDSQVKIPICRFGPGGDYQKGWPGESDGRVQYGSTGLFGQIGLIAGCLLRGLDFLSRALDGFRKEEVESHEEPASANTAALAPHDIYVALNTHVYRRIQLGSSDDDLFEISPTKARTVETGLLQSDTATDTDTLSYILLSRQQWLFPDLAGVGQSPAVKQSNRLRARRGTRGKRIVASSGQQDTLFDTE